MHFFQFLRLFFILFFDLFVYFFFYFIIELFESNFKREGERYLLIVNFICTGIYLEGIFY